MLMEELFIAVARGLGRLTAILVPAAVVAAPLVLVIWYPMRKTGARRSTVFASGGFASVGLMTAISCTGLAFIISRQRVYSYSVGIGVIGLFLLLLFIFTRVTQSNIARCSVVAIALVSAAVCHPMVSLLSYSVQRHPDTYADEGANDPPRNGTKLGTASPAPPHGFIQVRLGGGIGLEVPGNWMNLSDQSLATLSSGVHSVLDLSHIPRGPESDLSFAANLLSDDGRT